MDIRHEETALEMPGSPSHGPWPEDLLARVPYWVYQDEANYKREMQRLFEAATWNFVCLEADIPNKGDYRTNQLGEMPVIVVRDADGSINCFENRCAHRGALIAFDDGGNVQNNFKCIYHAWSYDLSGNLRGIAFERGINGLGGMPKDFQRETFSPRKLRTTTLCGLVFATLSPDTPPIEEYIGSEVLGRIKRVLNRPIRVMGRFVQPLPNNWKLYVENVKDTYHASLLHTFLATFRISRLTQGGGVLVSPTAATIRATPSPSPRAPTPRPTRISRSAPTRMAASRWPTPACSNRSRSSATTSSCRSCRCSPASSCSRSTIAWRSATSCPRRRQDGPGVDLFRLRRRSRPK